MSTHLTSLVWARGSAEFTYETYSRDHQWTFGGGLAITASAAPEFKGNRAVPNPEEALVAAISSCHMLTFLAICAKKGLVVERYEDHAEGYLEKNAEGRLAITRATLRPKVTFQSGVEMNADTLTKLHASAHHGCFIASSVKTEITVSPG